MRWGGFGQQCRSGRLERIWQYNHIPFYIRKQVVLEVNTINESTQIERLTDNSLRGPQKTIWEKGFILLQWIECHHRIFKRNEADIEYKIDTYNHVVVELISNDDGGDNKSPSFDTHLDSRLSLIMKPNDVVGRNKPNHVKKIGDWKPNTGEEKNTTVRWIDLSKGAISAHAAKKALFRTIMVRNQMIPGLTLGNNTAYFSIPTS